MRQSAFWNKAAENIPRAQLDALHLQQFQALIRHAYANSPFYPNKLDAASIHPTSIRTLENFKVKIPATDKSEFIHLQQE